MRADNTKNKKLNNQKANMNKTGKRAATRTKSNKKEPKGSKRETVFRLILTLILLVAIVCIGIYISKLNTDDFVENYNFYQYIGGRKISYQGAMKITSRGEITELTCTDKNIQLDSTPLYYTDTVNKVLFPANMELVVPTANGQIYKINRFSDVYMDENNNVYLEYRENKKELPEAFIYDGSNLYFFLSDATITVEGKEYELSPLSYVVAYNKSSVEIYNKEKDEYKTIETDGFGIVETKDYKINVSLDTMKYGDTEQLLLKKFDELQTFKFDGEQS